MISNLNINGTLIRYDFNQFTCEYVVREEPEYPQDPVDWSLLRQLEAEDEATHYARMTGYTAERMEDFRL